MINQEEKERKSEVKSDCKIGQKKWNEEYLKSTSEYLKIPDEFNDVNEPNSSLTDANKEEEAVDDTQTDEQNIKVVSIDVTKALLLLGFDKWSSLEPGDKKGDVAYVEEQLNKVVEERLTERRDYMELIAETREINFDLYLKMVQADENRSDAYSNEKKKDTKKKKLMIPQLSKGVGPLRRAKSTRGGRVLKKKNVVAEEPTLVATNEDTDVLQQDEEEVSLTWAYTVLMKEFYRRNELRDKVVITKKKTNDKLEALWRFRKLQVEKKNQEKKLEKERKKNELFKATALANSEASNIATKSKKNNKKGENGNEEADEPGGLKKKGSFKRKAQIFNIADQIDSKRRSNQDQHFTNARQTLYKLKTEEQKKEEAKKVLQYLKERQQIRDQIEGLEIKGCTKDVTEPNDIIGNANIGNASKDSNSKENSGEIEISPDKGSRNSLDADQDMKSAGSSNCSSVASSCASSRKNSKKNFFPRMKQKIKRTISDPAKNMKGNILAVPQRGAVPKSPTPPKRQIHRTASNPLRRINSPSANQKTAPITSSTRKMNKQSSTGTPSLISEGSDDSSSSFTMFVKNNLQEKGIIVDKEDEDIVNNAIEKILSANGMQEDTSGMVEVVSRPKEHEEQDQQRNPERYQKFRELSTGNINDDDTSLDDINMAVDEFLPDLQLSELTQSDMTGEEVVGEVNNEDSNHSANECIGYDEEDTRDSIDTFYSVKEEPEDESEDSDEFSFEKSFNLLSTVHEK